MPIIKIYVLLCCFCLCISCANEKAPTTTKVVNQPIEKKLPSKPVPAVKINDQVFERTAIKERLHQKIKNKEPLVVHLLVPLCDNDNQGIVKVSKSLGDGQNLRSNLYWGALYGIKTHFKKSADWKLIESIKSPDAKVLERVIFYKQFSNGVMVYLVADAYRGDRMEACLEDYFGALAGNKKGNQRMDTKAIELYAGADLIAFNGHNGLMDYPDFPMVPNTDEVYKDAVAVGCISQRFFKPYLLASKSYPLLMTTNLMAPEAYVMEAVINNWAMEKDGETIRKKAGDAYHQYQKCGVKGARRLFYSGW